MAGCWSWEESRPAENPLASAELYDPATGTWSFTGSLNTMRKDHALTVLPNGMILVTGGAAANSSPIASAELYDSGIVAATKVDGHGTIENGGHRVTFYIRASQSDDNASAGNFSFCDPAAGVCLTNAGIRSLSIAGNTAALSGKGHLHDGTKVGYRASVTDNGEPGILDTISITLSDGYSAGGTLIGGDIQIH